MTDPSSPTPERDRAPISAGRYTRYNEHEFPPAGEISSPREEWSAPVGPPPRSALSPTLVVVAAVLIIAVIVLLNVLT